MYTPDISLINECFPNAKIIIDPFHITQLVSRSLNKTRIDCMKNNKENYRKFKRYWRLFLTSRFDLDFSAWKKYICFKNLMTDRNQQISSHGKEVMFMGYDDEQQRNVARIDDIESKRATIGVHRCETTGTGSNKRTAWFYVGGGN